MKKIKIDVFYFNTWHRCLLSEVSGAGNELGSMWHLHSNDYFLGALHWTNNRGFWFGGNIGEEESIALQLERIVISWYE